MTKAPYDLDAVVLQDGHVDRITGPRCVVQMREGLEYGLYRIVRTAEVLTAGTPVLCDSITWRARALATQEQPNAR